MRYLITGANRGIGLELARQLLTRGDFVWGGTRRLPTAGPLADFQTRFPDQLALLQLDVTRPDQVKSAADVMRGQAGTLDILINNAGMFPRGERPESLSEDTLLSTFHINAVGPMTVTREMLPLIQASPGGKIINMTSQLGSLERKVSGGNYSYCSSKAALNMLSRALAADLKGRGIPVVVIHPGWVQTDMGGPGASLTPSQSVSAMIKLIDQISLADSGKFYTWDGRIHPW